MREPMLNVQLSDRGLRRIVVETDAGGKAGGFDLLARMLSSLRELDQKAREGSR